MSPNAPGKIALDVGIAFTGVGIASKSVAEADHAIGFGRSSAEDMQIDIGIRTFEHALLEPFGFPNPKDVACGFQEENLGIFVGRIRHDQQNVDDRLRAESQYGSRTDVFGAQRSLAKRQTDPEHLAFEHFGAQGIVLDENDGGVVRFPHADGDFPKILVAPESERTVVFDKGVKFLQLPVLAKTEVYAE